MMENFSIGDFVRLMDRTYGYNGFNLSNLYFSMQIPSTMGFNDVLKGVSLESNILSETNKMYLEFRDIYFKHFPEDKKKFLDTDVFPADICKTRIDGVINYKSHFLFECPNPELRHEFLDLDEIGDKYYYPRSRYKHDEEIPEKVMQSNLEGTYAEIITYRREPLMGSNFEYRKYFNKIKDYYITLYNKLAELKELTKTEGDRNKTSERDKLYETLPKEHHY